MTTRDLILYSFGNRAAIERIARSSTAFWAGLVLVATAGIARNYDHHLLYAEWQWLGGPIGVSLVSSVFIFWGICVMAGTCKGFWRQWRSFLGLFWLTAPMAWIYAIPVERFCDIRCATLWNLGFLLVVSVWRVALITRVVRVLHKVSFSRALGAVLGPASLEFLLASFLHMVHQSLSVTQIMGGISPTEDEQFLMDVANNVTGLACVVFVCGAILGIAALVNKRRSTAPKESLPAVEWQTFTPRGMILLGIVFAAWLAVSLVPQKELRLLRAVQGHFQQERYAEGLDLLAANQPGDFPPAYAIPPTDALYTAFQVAPHLRAEHPAWLQQVLMDYLADAMQRSYIIRYEGAYPALAHLARLPAGTPWVQKNRELWLKVFSRWQDHGRTLSEEQLEVINAMGFSIADIPPRETP